MDRQSDGPGAAAPANSLAVTLAVGLAFVAVLLLVAPRHEPWFDEAQAWLMARDMSPAELVADAGRYEGSPVLWHVLLTGPAHVGLPYAFIQWLAAGLALLGAVLLLHCAPLPLPLRVAAPFTFFLAYQYAVVARNYCLLPPLLWLLAVLHPRRDERPFLYVGLLALLANVSLHGTLIALALAGLHVSEVVRIRPKLWRWLAVAYAGFAAVVALVAFQLWPPTDLASPAPPGLNLSPANFVHVSADALNNALTEWPVLSYAALAASLVWFARKRCLALYLAPTLLLLALFAVKYMNAWHEGVLFLVWLFALWRSFAEPDRTRFDAQVLRPAVVGAALVVLGIQVYWAATALGNDWRFAYSGSRAAADCLRERGLDRRNVYAAGFQTVALLPYFADNRFANFNGGRARPCYWRWAAPPPMPAGDGLRPDSTAVSYAEIAALRPDAIVLGVKRPHQLDPPVPPGYAVVGAFPGWLFWKDRALEPDAFIVMERTDPPADPDVILRSTTP